MLATHLRASEDPRQDLRRAVQLVRNVRQSGNVLVTLPRSGSNWIILQLAVAFDLSRGGSGSFEYVASATPAGGGKWEPTLTLGWDAPPHLLALQLRRNPTDPIFSESFLTSHHPADHPVVDPTKHPSVVLVRNPIDQLDSVLRMVSKNSTKPLSELAIRHTEATIDFYNLWGDRIAEAGEDFHPVLRYEDVNADPAKALTLLSDRFGLKLSSTDIDGAVELTSRDRLLKRQPDGDWRVSKAGAVAPLSDMWWDRCRERLDSRLRHRFGYELQSAS